MQAVTEDVHDRSSAGGEDDASLAGLAAQLREERLYALGLVACKGCNDAPLPRQREAAPDASIERHADLAFELLQLRMNGGLREMKAPRGARHVRVLREDRERVEPLGRNHHET